MTREILTHQFHGFSMEGITLLATSRGGLYELDEVAGALWNLGFPELEQAQRRLSPPYPAAAVRRAWEELGRITSAPEAHSPDPVLPARRLRALCLLVSQCCNLACDYCFAQGGSYGSQGGLMDATTARRAIDFLLKESGATTNLQVDFFGGEPLLNLPVVFDAVGYGREQARARGKELQFTLTTNALLLDTEVRERLDRERIGLILSLDGPREVHDLHRRRADGGPSFDLAWPRIRAAIQARQGKDYYVRGTVTHLHPVLAATARALLEMGVGRISLEPVVSGPDHPYALTEADLDKLVEEYRSLARLARDRALEGRPFVFYHFLLDAQRPLCTTRRLTGCGVGVEYLAVSHQGDLYPCHQLAGLPRYRLGTLSTGPHLDPELSRLFARRHLEVQEECPHCWARYYCGGGCPAHALSLNGNLFKPALPACRLIRARLECALWLRAVAPQATP